MTPRVLPDLNDFDIGHADIPCNIKDPNLIRQRRTQICDAAIQLSRHEPFFRVTTRELAKKAHLNIATMYQYISCKDDVIYLTCMENISWTTKYLTDDSTNPLERLERRYEAFIQSVDARRDALTFVYQESRTLQPNLLDKVKAADERLVGFIEEPIRAVIATNHVQINDTGVFARLLIESGYMWANKGWSLAKERSLSDYIDSMKDIIRATLRSSS